ncbi:MAG: HNH endonuclease [Caulobacteraceae bacterium]|nr:HNH endonuclease [Caulobacteraceae bacterium]
MRRLKLPDKQLAGLVDWFKTQGQPAAAHAGELVRRRTPGGIALIRKGKGASVVLSHAAIKAVVEATARPSIKAARRNRLNRLAERDGWNCFYCDTALSLETATIEHLCSLKAEGPKVLDNLALACRGCNALAGSLPVTAKVRLRDQLRRRSQPSV